MNAIPAPLKISAFLLASQVLSGCSQEPTPPGRHRSAPVAPAATASAPPAPANTVALPGGSEAQKIFLTRCIVCHGRTGHGDGPGAAALTVKPRNYTDGNWQRAVTDEQIETIIVKGGAVVGKDPGMPANPDLKTKPDVVADLRKIVRSFAPKDAPAADAGSHEQATSPAKQKKGKGS
jgi:mono/diheme cytochrome c family protein